MKNKHLLTCAVLIAAVIFGACKNSNSGYFPEKETIDKDASYAIGMNLGASMRENMLADGIIPNMDEFLKGMKDGFGGLETRFDKYEAIEIIETALDALREERNAPLIQEEIEFLAQNAKRPEVIITPSGLQYEILKESNGPKPSLYDTVQVHYEGRFTDGYLFNTTYDYGRPVEFPVNDVFPGWSEGLQLMTVGSIYKFYIPSELAFGSDGNAQIQIPPYATLVFTVELLEIQ